MVSKKWLELAVLVTLAGLTTAIFRNGSLDIELARLFFRQDAEMPWPMRNFWLWRGLYDFGYPSVLGVIAVALSIILGGFYYKPLVRYRYRAAYFIAVIALGPGLIVNLVLKDHWGRPRPREVVEFNGSHHYQPPLVLSDNGKKSFVCGHCSSGYMFFALYFIVRRGKALVLICSFLYGSLFGIARMAAGGHWVSDILWSGYVVFGISWFLYYFFFDELIKSPKKHFLLRRTRD